MIHTLIASLALLTAQPDLGPDDPFIDTWTAIHEYTAGIPPMTATLITAPSIGSVADGVQVTTAHLTGLSAFIGTGSTWQSRANGDRYIQGVAGTSMIFIFLPAVTIDALTYMGFEIPLTHNLVSGQTWPNDDHRAVQFTSGGSTQFLFNTRALSASGDIRADTTQFATMVGTETERLVGRNVSLGESIRWGWGMHSNASGHAWSALDGQIMSDTTGIDTASLTDKERFGWFFTIDNAAIICEVDFPIRMWQDDSVYEEMVPDRSITSIEGTKGRRYSQVSLNIGPYKPTTSTLTITPTDYGTSGIIPARLRFKAGGTGASVLTLRAGHAVGPTIQDSKGYTNFVYDGIYPIAGSSIRLLLGNGTNGNIIDYIFNTSVGTSTTRQLQIGGSPTGLTFDETRRYKLTLRVGASSSSLILEDLTTTSTTAVRMQGVDWDRSGLSDASVWDKATINQFTAGSEVEPANQPATYDILICSSYNETSANGVIPVLCTANNAGQACDYFPNAGSRLSTGIYAASPFARSGHAIEDFKAIMGDYATMPFLAGARIVAIETLLNSDPSSSITSPLAAMYELIDECATNDVLLWFWTSMPLPSGGTNAYDDTYRANQRLFNDAIIAYMTGKGRPDLFTVSDIAAEYTDAEIKTEFFTVGANDTHMDLDGSELFVQQAVLLQMSVGVAGGNRSRGRGRGR